LIFSFTEVITMSELASKTCVPCKGGVPPLKGEALQTLQRQVEGWNVVEEHHCSKALNFLTLARH